MGELRNTAKKNSNFLKMEKGETVVVTYVDYRVIPSTMDPTKDTVQYKFATPDGDKFWTNGSSHVMYFFDDLPKGSIVKITRDKWFSKDGKTEDPNKSSYIVEKVEQ